ncbi:MAG: heavy metal-binding domain-containing protein [Eubacterium sp.]|nr:heavy metal-binding domain-containing protein [Eubacterium sp.]
MLVVNTETISGKELETLGLVKGSTVHSKNVGRDFMAGLKTIVGGEIKGYTEMMNEARNLATSRMIAEAEQLGADAVVNVRFTTSGIMQGAAEVIAYGTAVKYL